MTQNKDKKLFLLDAMALIYRAYFALSKNPRINSQGVNTSAVLGFANTLLDLLKKERPTHIGVAFDTHAPTVRHIEYAEYKANREKMPEDIGIALPYVRKLLSALKIPILEVDGYEADDVIGTLSKEAEKAGYTVYMVTPDKDYGQLVSNNIFMYKPSRMGSGVDILGVPEICEKFGIQKAEQVIDILGLGGDASDNIPGVPGVGAVTARKLLAQYGSIEELIEHCSEIQPASWGDKIKEYSKQALFSKKLATILLDVPISFDPMALCLEHPDVEETEALLSELDMKSFAVRLWTHYKTIQEDNWCAEKVDYAGERKKGKAKQKIVSEKVELDLFSALEAEENQAAAAFEAQKLQGSEWLTLEQAKTQFETIFTQGQPLSFAVSTVEPSMPAEQSAKNIYPKIKMLAFAHPVQGAFYYYLHQPILQEEKEWINAQILGRQEEWVVYNLKEQWHLFKQSDLDTEILEKAHCCKDIMLAHYIVNPDASHQFEHIVEATLRQSYSILPSQDARAIQEALTMLSTWTLLKDKLKQVDGQKLFEEIEMPLVYVLAHMEDRGVRIDTEKLGKYGQVLEAQIKEITQEIYTQAGVSFNISSPKQLGEVLYEKLQITDKPKHTKTKKWSTAEDVLQKLSSKNPIIAQVLLYRSLTKLKSTYVDALPLLANAETNKIHTTYNQAVAATGRLSSQNPNLQNIPVRSDMGREIRKSFIPDKKGDVLLSADYSQIELRIIASLSGDQSMQSDFSMHRDVHLSTAAKVFNVPLEEVTAQMRRMAKTVNFGIIYGISAFGLAERLSISRKDAADLIEKYFLQYPKLKTYMEDTIEEAKSKGFVETICQRRRYIPDIQSGNAVVRGYAERNAINAPIQGSSADMIKIAMIKIENRLKEEKCQTGMILQVHDELIFNIVEGESEKVKSIVEQEMKNALKLKVPLDVDIHTADNWSDAH